MTFRKYLVLAGVTVFSAVGDSFLNRGMKELGSIPLHDFPQLAFAIGNPWVACGILLLLAFFASYMAALSFADLTYVLPATSLSYVLVALIARFGFHESVSLARWVGIVLITAGVGFVAAGPSVSSTRERRRTAAREAMSQEAQS